MSQETIKESKNMLDTWDDDVMPAWIACVSFEYLAVIWIAFRLPFRVWGRYSKLSIVTNASRPLAKHNCSCLFNFLQSTILCACAADNDSFKYVVCNVQPEEISLHQEVNLAVAGVTWHCRVVWVIQEAFSNGLWCKNLNSAVNGYDEDN